MMLTFKALGALSALGAAGLARIEGQDVLGAHGRPSEARSP